MEEENLYDEFGNYIGPDLDRLVIFLTNRTKRMKTKSTNTSLKNHKMKTNLSLSIE